MPEDVNDLGISGPAVSGPPFLTVAKFIELALYHPSHGYYSTRARRSGPGGDFTTSVDVGPLFGEMLAVQVADVCAQLREDRRDDEPFDLVEAGAGDGRLMRDILDATSAERPDLYARLRVTLVERSASARAAAERTLAPHASRVAAIATHLPPTVRGVILANELLDAMAVHVLAMTADGLREIYLRRHEGRLVETTGPLSDERLRPGADEPALAPGARAERGLAAQAWIAEAGRSLDRGALLVFDYFRRPSAIGTLIAYSRQTAASRWFDAPGRRDITAHVDLEGVRRAARAAGLDEAGAVDQTSCLMALGMLDRLPGSLDAAGLRRRLNAKALMLPGGLGSTIKAVAFTRHMEGRELRGFTGRQLT